MACQCGQLEFFFVGQLNFVLGCDWGEGAIFWFACQFEWEAIEGVQTCFVVSGSSGILVGVEGVGVCPRARRWANISHQIAEGGELGGAPKWRWIVLQMSEVVGNGSGVDG